MEISFQEENGDRETERRRTNKFTFSSVSRERSLAFSRDLRTAMLLRSRRRRYSSVPLSARLLRLEQPELAEDETLLTELGLGLATDASDVDGW